MQIAEDVYGRRMSRSTGSLRSRDGLASARGILTSVLGGLLGWAGIVWAVSRLW